MLRSAILPTIFALVLHGAVLGLLLHNWESPPPQVASVEPLYIAAKVVNVAPKPKQVATPKPKPPAQVSESVSQAPQVFESPVVEPDEDPVAEYSEDSADQIVEVAGDHATQDQDVDQAMLEADLMRAIAAEEGARAAVTDDEQVMAYIGQIQRDIAQNWSRPPSARNGMEAILRVFLVPTGEVVDVRIAESSGNTAFDRSALVAVEKVDRFAVPDDSSLFEKSFREFTLLFRPEDLRL